MPSNSSKVIRSIGNGGREKATCSQPIISHGRIINIGGCIHSLLNHLANLQHPSSGVCENLIKHKWAGHDDMVPIVPKRFDWGRVQFGANSEPIRIAPRIFEIQCLYLPTRRVLKRGFDRIFKPGKNLCLSFPPISNYFSNRFLF